MVIAAFSSAIILNLMIPEYDQRSNYIFGSGLLLIILMRSLFKRDKFYNSLKFLLIFLIWVTFNFSWYLNHGFTRSVIILFAFFFTFIIFIQSNRGIIISAILMALNLGVLFFISHKWPEVLAGDWTEEQDRIDIIFTLIIGWIFIPAYVIIAKNKYVSEYRKALKSENLKSAFLANMSHEIRTPLNAITGFSELIKEDPELRNNEQYLDVIYSNSIYLNELIDQVLNISVIESGNLKLNMQEFTIKKLFDRLKIETYQNLERRNRSKVRVKTVLEDKELRIFTDRIQLEQVLKNLITNAVKFTRTGEIQIGVDLVGSEYKFYVSDTGKGIAAEDLPTIFDRFVKLNGDQHGQSRGVGLGLYLCKRIVIHLGGTLTVKSEIGKGSTFQFTLPRTKPA